MAPPDGETWAKKRFETMSRPWRSAATRSCALGRRGLRPCAARSALTRQRTARPTAAAGAWPAATVVAAQGGDAAWVGGANNRAATRARGVAMAAAMSRRGGTELVTSPAIGREIAPLDPPCAQVDGRYGQGVERGAPTAAGRPRDTGAAAG